MKILIWMVIPSIICYVFWITYKFFNRSAPEAGSKEDLGVLEDDHLV